MKENNEDIILSHLKEIKNRTLSSLNSFKEECSNRVLLEKIEKVQASVSTLSCDVVSDETIKRFLMIQKVK